MNYKTGNIVQIKPGNIDPDAGQTISGWSGRVVSIDTENQLLTLEWDSITLIHLPDSYIRESIDQGYDYFRYVIEIDSVEKIPAKDTPEDVKEIQEKLNERYRNYELHGDIPTPSPAPQASITSNNPHQQLLAILQSIQGSGSFATSGDKKFVSPGLQVKGFGELAFPVNDVQAQSLIQLARQAPFGKGSQTITDTRVRNSWEIDASQLTFRHAEWPRLLDKILKKVKKDLGIQKEQISASLYKLLIYEKGSFFKPHKDSEKEPGMFGTLVIGLPTAHTGGELAVRFENREEKISFAEAAGQFRIPFAAFYADCDHELLPVTSGYRICLVYNLLQTAGSPRLATTSTSEQAGQMVPLLQALEPGFTDQPLAILLGHQYTPANFSLDNLKGHDRPRAEALLSAAEKAGYFADFGLVTHYQMGDLEEPIYKSSRYRRYDYYSYDDPVGGSMGDIHDLYTKIDHWSGDGAPSLGSIDLDEDDLLTDLNIGEGEPIEQEAEGYTGNAGMTIEYWYHYGAVMLWPKSKHAGLLTATPIQVRLEWLKYYLQHWKDPSLEAPGYVRQIIEGISPDKLKAERYKPDFSVLATALIRLSDRNLLKKKGLPVLEITFCEVDIPGWVSLLQTFDPATFSPVFKKAVREGGKPALNHYVALLTALEAADSTGYRTFIQTELEQLPDQLTGLKMQKTGEPRYSFLRDDELSNLELTKAIVRKCLQLAPLMETYGEWLQQVALPLRTRSLPRDYANQVLIAVLLERKHPESGLSAALQEFCITDLKARTKTRPVPPSDWRRKVPVTQYNREIWDMLRPFLESPTEREFHYRANEQYRRAMENAVEAVRIDLKMETIRRGSPYTLKLIKTKAGYKRKLKEWEEDLGLLGEMEKT